MSARLQGQVILNTRPAHQQGDLSSMLEQDGATVLSFPVIEIAAPDDAVAQQWLIDQIDSYDFLLFVSRNAVDGAFRMLGNTRINPTTAFGVIGTATRQALAGYVDDLDSCLLAGEPYNSESLLDVQALRRVSGKRVLILRGQQGRNLLGDELVARGAQVDYCEVYRRQLPTCEVTAFNRLVAPAMPTLALLTSNEGMHNLFELIDAPAAAQMRAIPWLLISERMRESALKLGHNAPIIIAHSASDKGIRQAICDWTDHR